MSRHPDHWDCFAPGVSSARRSLGRPQLHASMLVRSLAPAWQPQPEKHHELVRRPDDRSQERACLRAWSRPGFFVAVFRTRWPRLLSSSLASEEKSTGGTCPSLSHHPGAGITWPPVPRRILTMTPTQEPRGPDMASTCRPVCVHMSTTSSESAGRASPSPGTLSFGAGSVQVSNNRSRFMPRGRSRRRAPYRFCAGSKASVAEAGSVTWLPFCGVSGS